MNTRELVYVAKGVLDAEMIRVFLESNEIKAFVMQESVGLTYGLTLGPLGECKIYVEPKNVRAARELISLYEAGEIDQTELDTGETQEADFDNLDS